MQHNLFNFSKMEMSNILNMVADCVGSTLGPKGNVVVIGNGEISQTTKDGVSVLRFLQSDNTYINNVINVIKESAENTLRTAGDGTTSTVLIANEMLKALSSKAISPDDLKKKVNEMIEKIPELSKELTTDNAKTLIDTAIGGEPELAKALYEGYTIAEKEDLGIIIESSLGDSTRVEVINGVYFKANLISNVFEKDNNVMENPHVILYSGTIETEREVIKAIDKALKMGIKDIVLIANKYTEEAVSIMSINHLQGNINILPLAINGGDMHNNDIMSLIAKALGAEVGGEQFSSRLYDAFTKPYTLVDKVKYENGKVIFEGIKADNDLTEEINIYLEKMKKSENDATLNKHMFILSILKRKVVKVIVGANIENKLSELKDRADDAIQSILTAKDNGIVKGAGKTYVELNKLTSNHKSFSKIFDVISNKVGDYDNALDSAKVISSVLTSASELALLLYNTSYVITIANKKS